MLISPQKLASANWFLFKMTGKPLKLQVCACMNMCFNINSYQFRSMTLKIIKFSVQNLYLLFDWHMLKLFWILKSGLYSMWYSRHSDFCFALLLLFNICYHGLWTIFPVSSVWKLYHILCWFGFEDWLICYLFVCVHSLNSTFV